MGDVIPYNPNPIFLQPPPPKPPPPPPPSDLPDSAARGSRFLAFKRPPLRLTTEFDSESSLFYHKISCKFFDRIAKLKFSFQNDTKGEILYPQLCFVNKYFSVLYDMESMNALLKGSIDFGKDLKVRTTYDVQEQQGAVTMTASYPSVKAELSTSVPSVVLPRVKLQFPFGEVAVEQRENVNEHEEVYKVLSVGGILKSHMLNGICTAMYSGNDLNLRYSYKDKEISFIPSVRLPSNALSFAFKRRFSTSDKISYWYHFDSSAWNAVYKHTISKDLKFKAGYDSAVQLGWASLWVGPEDGKAKAAPMKLKVQMMLQVPRDGINRSVLLFRLKKRWDF